MKKLLQYTSLIIPVIFLFACGSETSTQKSDHPTSVKKFHNPTLKFGVEYPADWTINYDPDSVTPGAAVKLLSPLSNPNDLYQENIFFVSEAFPMKISDSVYHQAVLTQLQVMNPELKVKKEDPLLLGSNRYQQHSFVFEKDSLNYLVKSYTITKDSLGFTINFTGTSSDWPMYEKTVESILTTFTFTK